MTNDPHAAHEGLVLGERRVDHPDAAALLRAFYDEQIGRYGFAESIGLDPYAYAAPNGIFIVVYQHGRPVGGGGCRWYDQASGTVEIKKTYLVPDVRGRGVGQTLLATLEQHGIGWGAQRIILETGVRNIAALALFASRGYRPMAGYVSGRDSAINRAFTKPLRSTSISTENASPASVR